MPVLKHFNLLNFILIAVFLIFLHSFLFPRLVNDDSVVVLPLIKKPAVKTFDEPFKTQTLSPQDYRAIADENLFHPDRIIPLEKKAEAVLPKPEFVLYGTLITPDLKMAYLEDKKAPVTTPGRGQRQSALKIGESLSGFRLKEVHEDKVVLTRGEETIQVLLQDPNSAKNREASSGPGIASVPGMRPAGTHVGPGLPVGPGNRAPVPSAPPPSTASPAFPQPGRTMPLVPGSRPIPSGRLSGLPSPRTPTAPPPSH
jgi:hypothetical protein